MLSTFTIILLLSFVGLAYCSQTTFNVPALHQTTNTLSLNQGDYVSGSIVVAGGISNAINFHITDPSGNNVVSYNDVVQTSFSFTASSSGNYTVYFDNRGGAFAKSVTFDYSIKASILGIPQDTFILLLAIIIVIIVIIIAVLLVLRRRPKEAPKAA